MCLAIPAKILSIQPPFAHVQTIGVEQTINIQLIQSPQPGEYVLVHAGFAIEKIQKKDYVFLHDTLETLLQGDEHE